MSAREEAALTQSRRIEELALNASGGPHSLVYDGWLLGYRRDPSKRYRCINPFYASALALDAKIEHCIAFYAGIGLPTLFRLLPFSQPRELDSVLDRRGWAAFERTRVLRCSLADLGQPARPAAAVELVEPPAWEPHAAPLLNVDSEALPRFIARAANHPLPQLGALVRRQGEVIACGLLKIEAGHAGLFAIHTAEAWRGQGFGRAVVAALLDEARRRGAGLAYLQVTAENAPALALYRRFGFTAAHDYWYRAREGEQH
ncbi:MAG TPA: GNAT family N-acetyltransferase [Casimicrobiaceae bacterium]